MIEYCLLGNDVQFHSVPVLERTMNITIIKGCTYTSARNKSLHAYAYIKINEVVYSFEGNNTTHHQRDNRFVFPDMSFDRWIGSAFISCIIQIPGEWFISNSSKLYQKPGKNRMYFYYAPFLFYCL